MRQLLCLSALAAIGSAPAAPAQIDPSRLPAKIDDLVGSCTAKSIAFGRPVRCDSATIIYGRGAFPDIVFMVNYRNTAVLTLLGRSTPNGRIQLRTAVGGGVKDKPVNGGGICFFDMTADMTVSVYDCSFVPAGGGQEIRLVFRYSNE